MLKRTRPDYLDGLGGDQGPSKTIPKEKASSTSLWVSARRKDFNRETLEQCRRWQAQSIRVLRTGDQLQQRLAAKLRACSEKQPCNSEACAHCMYAFRTRLFEQSVNVVIVGGTRCSIISSGMKVDIGDLSNFNVKAHVRRLQKRVSRSSILKRCLIIGGIDISWNVDHWQGHLYLLIHHANTPKFKAAVRAAFPEEPTAHRPYNFKRFVDRLEVVGYSYKMRFNKHQSYLDADADETGDDFNDNRIPDQFCPELLMFLDSYPIGCRMLLRGIRRHGRRLNLKIIDHKAARMMP